MSGELFDRIEQLDIAHRLRGDLGIAVDHLAHGLDLLLLGHFNDAHWELWRGGFTKEIPWSQVPMTISEVA